MVVAVLELVALRVGDCDLRLGLDAVDELRLGYTEDRRHARLRFRFPVRNVGVQQGLLIDAYACLQPAGEHYSELNPVCRLINPLSPRKDGYWEACIVPAGKELPVEVELWMSADDLPEQLAAISELRFDFFYKYYCRNPLTYRRSEVSICMSEVMLVDDIEAQGSGVVGGEGPDASDRSRLDDEAKGGEGRVIPLKAGLIRPGDSIVEHCIRSLGGRGESGDILAISETPVAIAQGRAVYCEDIRPRYLATRFNRFFGMNASMSSVYAMELAMQEVGVVRIALAMLAGMLGKMLGREGDFYRVAGRSVAVIDDCTGTLPPFDKHVVLAPLGLEQLVDEIKGRTGLEVAVVDANDLGKVDVLAITNPSCSLTVIEALKPNPQGNSAEMTPFVLIRR